MFSFVCRLALAVAPLFDLSQTWSHRPGPTERRSKQNNQINNPRDDFCLSHPLKFRRREHNQYWIETSANHYNVWRILCPMCMHSVWPNPKRFFVVSFETHTKLCMSRIKEILQQNICQPRKMQNTRLTCPLVQVVETSPSSSVAWSDRNPIPEHSSVQNYFRSVATISSIPAPRKKMCWIDTATLDKQAFICLNPLGKITSWLCLWCRELSILVLGSNHNCQRYLPVVFFSPD